MSLFLYFEKNYKKDTKPDCCSTVVMGLKKDAFNTVSILNLLVDISQGFVTEVSLIFSHHTHHPHGLFRQSLNGTGNGNGNLINIVPNLSHCNGNWNLRT